jgi:integrase
MAIQAVKNGRYEVNIYLGNDSPRYRKQFPTLQEARIHEAEIQLKLLKGEEVCVSQKKVLIFQDVYEEWWNKKYTKTTTNTAMTYVDTERYFRLHILPFLGQVKIKEINYDLIENLQNTWAFGSRDGSYPAQANYKKYINYASKVFRYAVAKGYMKKNFFDVLDKPVNSELKLKKEIKRNQKYYPQEIVLQTLQGMKALHGLQAYTLLYLIYALGAAKGEIYPLTWGDIDLDQRILLLGHRLVKDKKTGLVVREEGMKNLHRFRKLRLDDSLVDLLVQWKQAQVKELAQLGIKQTNEQFLFTYITSAKKINQPLGRDWLNRKLNDVEKVYGLPHIMPHGFRHTFISDSLNAGVNEFALKGIVGHSAVSHVTESVYGHSDLTSQAEVFNLVENARRTRTPLVHLGTKKDTSPHNQMS